MPKRLQRSLEAIRASGIAQIRYEAPQIVPGCGEDRLYRLEREGRLETMGKPKSVRIQHLMEQFEAGFPVLKKDESAA